MKRQKSKPKPHNRKKKARPAAQRSENRKIGLGTAIASHFRRIGLKEGEEIPELLIKLQIPDFE